jgi:hypothetical protein
MCEECEREAVDVIHVAHLSSGLPGDNCPRRLSRKHHTRRGLRRSIDRARAAKGGA